MSVLLIRHNLVHTKNIIKKCLNIFYIYKWEEFFLIINKIWGNFIIKLVQTVENFFFNYSLRIFFTETYQYHRMKFFLSFFFSGNFYHELKSIEFICMRTCHRKVKQSCVHKTLVLVSYYIYILGRSNICKHPHTYTLTRTALITLSPNNRPNNPKP